MNKKLIVCILLLTLIGVNLFALKSFWYNFFWKKEYNNQNYEKSIKYFEKSWNLQWVFNKANSLYKQWKYVESIKEYMSLLTQDPNLINFRLNHNIWNNFYRIWEQENNIVKRIKNWEESVGYYRNALEIMYDEETKQNLEFVLNKIEEEQKKQEEKEESEEQKKDDNQEKNEQENQNNDSKDWENNENKDQESEWKKEENNSQNENWEEQESWNKESESWDKKWEWNEENQESDWVDNSEKSDEENQSWKTWETSKEQEEKSLSQEQTQAIQEYEESLKQAQKDYSDSFNKVYEWDSNNDPFDEFFNDPFFNNDLLNWWNWEKDW